MARINEAATTATSRATDDYLLIDGDTNGTRRILVSDTVSIVASGAIYVTTPADTTPDDTVNYKKCEGVTSLNNSESVVMDFDMPANNRLRYTGTAPIHAHIAVSLSVTTGSNNQVTSFRVYKYDDSGASGATLVHTTTQRKAGTMSDVSSTAMHGDCVLNTNDYLEVWVKNETSVATVTLQEMYMFALGMRYLA